QMGVQVDEPRREHEAVAVDDGGAGGRAHADHAVLDRDVGGLVPSRGRIDDPRPLQEELHAPVPPSIRYRSDIRTAMPFVTCSVITLCGRSATSDAISTPRFIGPGCMIIAPSGSAATRSRDSPYSRAYSRTLGKNC